MPLSYMQRLLVVVPILRRLLDFGKGVESQLPVVLGTGIFSLFEYIGHSQVCHPETALRDEVGFISLGKPLGYAE